MPRVLIHNNQVLYTGSGFLTTEQYTEDNTTKIFVGSASADTRYSLDGGSTWQQMDYSSGTGTHTYSGWASFSSDGTHILVHGYNAYTVWVSNDGGESWNARTGQEKNIRFSTTSGDGKYMAHGGANSGGDGRKSLDYGVTWGATGVPNGTSSGNAYFYAPMTNDDGQYTIVGRSWNSTSEPEKIYRSTDYMSTFSGSGDTGMLNKYMTVSMSSSGQYVLVGNASVSYNPGIWISDDYGATWSQLTTDYGQHGVSNDAGMIVYSRLVSANIYTSINQGSSWRTLSNVGANGYIRVSKIKNRVFQYNSAGSILYEIDTDGTSRTIVKDFGALVIRDVSCGDNEIGVILTNKDLYTASYDDITNWTNIYTFEGTSASTYLALK